MPTVNDILTCLEQFAPYDLAESWDNVGLMAGDRTQTVSRVLCALDVTETVAQEAHRIGAQLIVAHHPLIFTSVRHVTADDVTGRVKTYEAIVKGHNVPKPGVPESFKVLVKELQSLCLDIKVLDENGDEIELKDDEDEETGFGRVTLGDEDLSLYDENTIGNDVSSDEAADNGYEIQDEDDVFGLLNDLGSDSDSAGDEE